MPRKYFCFLHYFLHIAFLILITFLLCNIYVNTRIIYSHNIHIFFRNLIKCIMPYLYIHIYTHVYTYVFIDTCTHVLYKQTHTHICIYMYIYKMYTMHLIMFLKSTTVYEEYYMGGDINMSFLFSMPSCTI